MLNHSCKTITCFLRVDLYLIEACIMALFALSSFLEKSSKYPVNSSSLENEFSDSFGDSESSKSIRYVKMFSRNLV